MCTWWKSRAASIPPIRLIASVFATMAIACSLPLFMVALGAQSLADVAREEAARRREIKRPAKIYTNKDLVSVPPPAVPVPVPVPGSADAAAAAKPPASTDDKAESESAATSSDSPRGASKDQASWSGRMKSLLERLERDRLLSDALQSRINALTTDFSARDDPAQRRLIELERQKTLDELDRLRTSTVMDQKAIADLGEEARRASVPPGWIR